MTKNKRRKIFVIILIIISVIIAAVLFYLEFHYFFITGLSRRYVSDKFNIEITKDIDVSKYKETVHFKDGPLYELYVNNIGNDYLKFMQEYCQGDIWSYSENGEDFNDGEHKYNSYYKGLYGCDEYVVYERNDSDAAALFFKNGETYDMILLARY